MRRSIAEMLACPVCHASLAWEVTDGDGEWWEMGTARCAAQGHVFPLREGIGHFLVADRPDEDLWEQAESRLSQNFRANPDMEARLLGAPLSALAPADQMIRALVLEERGDFAGAAAASDAARPRLYTTAYLACHERQLEYVVARAARDAEPIVDLASGQGALIERLARQVSAPLIATDISPRVLRRTQRRLAYLGLPRRVTFLACDARRTPFRDAAIPTMTTNLGLPNIAGAEDVARELRRIIAGTFLAISAFYAEDDAPNVAALREAGLATFAARRSTEEVFARAGWATHLVNVCHGRAEPTPASALVDGLRIDGLPVAPTTLEWGVLVAR